MPDGHSGGNEATDSGNGYGDSGKAIGATKAQEAILQGNVTVYINAQVSGDSRPG